MCHDCSLRHPPPSPPWRNATQRSEPRWDGHPELAELIVDTREYAAFDAGVIQSALRGVVPSDEWECLMGDLTERFRNGEPIHLHTTLLRHIRDANSWVIQDTADRAILAWAATDWTQPTWCLPDDAPPDADPSQVGHLPSFQEAILGRTGVAPPSGGRASS